MELDKLIIAFLHRNPHSSSREIQQGISEKRSIATVKRTLSKLASERLITITGKGRATRYRLSPYYNLIREFDLDDYYEKEIDERIIIDRFNFSLLRDILPAAVLFTEEESARLARLHKEFEQNMSKLSEYEIRKEFERLAIDLSWKSSQIEGNTYSLLETERLLREKETAAGKSKEEAIMLLNHKEAIDFIIENPDYLFPLSVSKIEDIHSILIRELSVPRNIRRGKVGISGTNYRPIDNEFQIQEALSLACNLINRRENVFEQALLALVLISYIQPFVGGNKRTARIVSNAILIHHRYCPVSFRTVDSIEYKKAILLFYEQNNISAIKRIFIEQYAFAVKTYF